MRYFNHKWWILRIAEYCRMLYLPRILVELPQNHSFYQKHSKKICPSPNSSVLNLKVLKVEHCFMNMKWYVKLHCHLKWWLLTLNSIHYTKWPGLVHQVTIGPSWTVLRPLLKVSTWKYHWSVCTCMATLFQIKIVKTIAIMGTINHKHSCYCR